MVHAGLHYGVGTLKTRLSIRGGRLLAAWCAAKDVPFSKVGKFIVATDNESCGRLAVLLEHAAAVGIEGLEIVGERRLRASVPFVEAREALWVPTTGIVDPVALCQSLLQAARDRGASILPAAKVTNVRSLGEGLGYVLSTTRGSVRARKVVNAAGLRSDELARTVDPDAPSIRPCRGDYYRLARKLSCPHLVYPLPNRAGPGLGVHLTIDLAGGVRFGPDAYFVDGKDAYEDPPPEKRGVFARDVRRLFPTISEEDLVYDTCGLRPRLERGETERDRDFVVRESPSGFVSLLGIDSPGLTASLALAELVEAILI